MVAHGFAKMLLSSGNPWPVTKQDTFHSLINYREENCMTTPFEKTRD